MELGAATWWWVLAGILVAAELATGTFYLLMLAVGGAAGAIAAHLGFSFNAQLVTAALLAAGATALWHFKRASAPRSAPAESNRDVNLDIGQTVQVGSWGSDQRSRVQYRGASWEVRYAGTGQPTAGEHVIVALHGNRLDVAPTRAN